MQRSVLVIRGVHDWPVTEFSHTIAWANFDLLQIAFLNATPLVFCLLSVSKTTAITNFENIPNYEHATRAKYDLSSITGAAR